MRILLTNDDGVFSPVLRRSAVVLAERHEVVVAAPSRDQSGMSHAFTHGEGRLLAAEHEEAPFGPLYRVDGTPADCVKFAVAHLLKDRLPDLVVSGPNLGENAGISAVYSGTVAAAREAALWNVPGIALSLSETSPAHLEHALGWLLALLEEPGLLPVPGSFWNVNFPPCAPSAVAGARFTRMSTAMFTDHYDETVTPHGVPGYLLRGRKPVERFEPGTDDDVLRRGFIAVTPLRVSQGDEEALKRLAPRESLLNALRAPSPANAAPA